MSKSLSKAVEWWISGKVSFQEKNELTIKHFGSAKIFNSDNGVYSLTDEEIEKIYLAEKIK